MPDAPRAADDRFGQALTMSSSFRLGRIAGVEIGANWTWLLVVALILWTLAGGVFPAANPGLSDGVYLAMAAVAALAFFASLTFHELGHALQARREGITIDGITLWVFGGVARLRGDLPSAGAELRVALAGPAVSLVLGMVLLGAALALPLGAAADGVIFWLGQINLYLLMFNLLPALPLDGGRVLRALLWGRSGDFLAATQTAAALGRGFGQALIAMGLLLVFLVGAFGGLWLAFIGWFLLGAADTELRAASTRHALAGLTVTDVLVRDPVSVESNASVADFMEDVFFPTRHTAFPVLRNGEPVGLVTFRRALQVPRDAWRATTVEEIMTPAAEVRLPAEAPLSQALTQLTEREPRRALVYRDGELAGLLSLTDVTRVLEARAGPGAGPHFTPPWSGAGPAGERPA
jgi:Zn-dependent protease